MEPFAGLAAVLTQPAPRIVGAALKPSMIVMGGWSMYGAQYSTTLAGWQSMQAGL